MKVIRQVNNYFFDTDKPALSDCLFFYGSQVLALILTLITIGVIN